MLSMRSASPLPLTHSPGSVVVVVVAVCLVDASAGYSCRNESILLSNG